MAPNKGVHDEALDVLFLVGPYFDTPSGQMVEELPMHVPRLVALFQLALCRFGPIPEIRFVGLPSPWWGLKSARRPAKPFFLPKGQRGRRTVLLVAHRAKNFFLFDPTFPANFGLCEASE